MLPNFITEGSVASSKKAAVDAYRLIVEVTGKVAKKTVARLRLPIEQIAHLFGDMEHILTAKRAGTLGVDFSISLVPESGPTEDQAPFCHVDADAILTLHRGAGSCRVSLLGGENGEDNHRVYSEENVYGANVIVSPLLPKKPGNAWLITSGNDTVWSDLRQTTLGSVPVLIFSHVSGTRAMLRMLAEAQAKADAEAQAAPPTK